MEHEWTKIVMLHERWCPRCEYYSCNNCKLIKQVFCNIYIGYDNTRMITYIETKNNFHNYKLYRDELNCANLMVKNILE